METIKEMETIVSETEAPALAPYGYKAGDKMTIKMQVLLIGRLVLKSIKSF